MGASDRSSCRTQSQLMSWYQSRKLAKMKVVKWGFKKLNGHILMHIYHKKLKSYKKFNDKAQTTSSLFLGSQLLRAKKL